MHKHDNNELLGDIIRKQREKLNKSISDVAKDTNISYTVLQRIENGITQHPALPTLEKITGYLRIPFEDYISIYIKHEKKTVVVKDLLDKAIQLKSIGAIFDIIEQYILIANKSAVDSFVDLLEVTKNCDNKEIASAMFSMISKKAAEFGENGIMVHAMFYEYLIVRNIDIKQSYFLGKRLVEWAHLLPTHLRIEARYRVAVHARFLGDYRDCIEIIEEIFNDPGDKQSPFYQDSYQAYYTSLLLEKKYEKADFYLEEFAELFDKRNSSEYVIDKAVIFSKTGHVEKAIVMLESYLEDYELNLDTINALNEILKLYLLTGQHNKALEFLKIEEKFDHIFEIEERKGPFAPKIYGVYLIQKGRIQFVSGNIQGASESLLQSMEIFASLRLRDEFLRSMDILTQMIKDHPDTDVSFVQNVQHKMSVILNNLMENKSWEED